VAIRRSKTEPTPVKLEETFGELTVHQRLEISCRIHLTLAKTASKLNRDSPNPVSMKGTTSEESTRFGHLRHRSNRFLRI